MKRLSMVLAGAVLAAVVPALPAGSAPASLAWCTGAWHVDIRPGAGMTPGTSAFSTPRGTGTVTCVGKVNGHDVTGTGTAGQDGTLHGTALSGTGSGTKVLEIPTTAGQQVLSVPFRLEYAAGVGLKYGAAFAGPFTFVFYPTAGTGLTEPVTQIGAVAEFVLET